MGELQARLQTRVGRFELDVEFDTRGGRLAVVGPNGAGKTTLVKALLGAIPVERGWVSVDGRRLVDTDAGVVVPMEERGLGYVPQDYALFPHLTVQANVEFPMVPRVRSKSKRSERCQQLLEGFGVVHLALRRAASLSGGEMQRVALARALAAEPQALLLDEPLAALDVGQRRDVQRFLAEHLSKLALPTLVVTHDAGEARVLGERVLVIEAGRATQLGTFEELSRAPKTPFVAQFVGK